MADGCHFKNNYLQFSALLNYPIWIKFGRRMQFSIPSLDIFDKKNEILQNQDGGRTPY